MPRQVEGSTYIQAPRELVYSVLSAYRSYERWNPEVTGSRVLESEGNVTVAQFIVPRLGAEKLILEFVGSPSHRLSYRQVGRYREDGLVGHWSLEEVDGSASTVLEGKMSWRGRLFEVSRRRHLDQVLGTTLDAVRSRALRLADSDGTKSAGERRMLLDLDLGEQGLRVELDGRIFHIGPKERGGHE